VLQNNTDYKWRVIAYDEAGNNRTSTSTFHITTDSIKPDIQISTPLNNTWIDSTFNPIYTVYDRHIDTCELHTNLTGTYQPNQTDRSIPYGESTTFPTTNLIDGTRFRWAIACNDSAGNINWTQNYTNRVDGGQPTAFIIYLPVNGTVSTDLRPNFTWNQTVEGNFLNYTFQLSTSKTFAYTNYTIGMYKITNTSFHFRENISTNTKWYGRTIAYDQATNTRISNVQHFTTDTQSPTEVHLYSPVNKTYTATNFTPTFIWNATRDINFHNYTLQIDNNSDFNSIEFEYHTTGTLYNRTYTFM
jgi:hypothetical protein